MIRNKYTALFPKDNKKKESRFDDLQQTKLDDRWKWHSIIFTFITELNMKEKDVYKMNYISSLNWLSFLNEKNKIENNKNNKI